MSSTGGKRDQRNENQVGVRVKAESRKESGKWSMSPRGRRELGRSRQIGQYLLWEEERKKV